MINSAFPYASYILAFRATYEVGLCKDMLPVSNLHRLWAQCRRRLWHRPVSCSQAQVLAERGTVAQKLLKIVNFLGLVTQPDPHQYMKSLRGSTLTRPGSSSHAVFRRSQMIQKSSKRRFKSCVLKGVCLKSVSHSVKPCDQDVVQFVLSRSLVEAITMIEILQEVRN
jgi:hypothetical protein